MREIDYSDKVVYDYDTDYEKAWEMAHASDHHRSMAAAGRLISQIIEPHLEATKDDSPISLAKEVSLVEQLMEIRGHYPRAFNNLSSRGFEKLDLTKERDMLAALPEILKLGGLPLRTHDFGNYRITPEKLDQEAELREQIAAIICDYPPSRDFLIDHQLWDDLKRGSGKFSSLSLPLDIGMQVDMVIGLMGLMESCAKDAAEKNRCKKVELKRYDDLDENPAGKRAITKMQFVIQKLIDLSPILDDSSFPSSVRAALNYEESTLQDLKELWIMAMVGEIKLFENKAEAYQQIVNAIISGKAARYKSPVDYQ